MALRSKEERGGGSGGAAGAGGDGGAAGADARGRSPCGGGLIEMDETFYERVYVQVRKVPAGSVCTYGDIAALAGYPGAAREVGLAMSRVQRAWNLPCHRIVNAKGTLAPSYAFGGKDRQRALLEAEGVPFLDSDTIDMPRARWPRPEPPELPQQQLDLGI